MPECPHCSRDVDQGIGHICPACGKDMLLPPAASEPKPFDVAEVAKDLELTPPPLHGAHGDEGGNGSNPRPAPSAAGPPERLASQAGPARPVRRADVAATGWGAAQPGPAGGFEPESTPPPLPATEAPPPLPPRRSKTRPAHLLLAELEAKRGEAMPSQDLSADMPSAEIAQAQVEKPAVPKATRGPSDRLIRGIAALVVTGGIFAVYWNTQSEPEPEVEVDAALVSEVERRRRAVEALETGHALVLQGPDKADAAIAAYQKALELAPDLASAERGLGISYAAKDQEAQAVEHYRRYLELDPKAGDAGEVKKIIADYERAQRRAR